MRERARAFLAEKNHNKADEKLEKANAEIEELKKQVNLLLRTRIPKKAKDTDVEHDAATGDAGHE
jgi:cell division protein FtsL